jgi:hypothetical protein
MTDMVLDWEKFLTDADVEKIRGRRSERRVVDITSAQSVERHRRNQDKRRRVRIEKE